MYRDLLFNELKLVRFLTVKIDSIRGASAKNISQSYLLLGPIRAINAPSQIIEILATLPLCSEDIYDSENMKILVT